jgi:predicted DNA-binding mobile mystery protein A
MSQRLRTNSLRRKQLDRIFSETQEIRQLSRPRKGWIREIRDALGMSAKQLARRLGIRQSGIAKMEGTEVAETISLQSLRKVADALDCELVYAFVPRSSLEVTLRTQALRRAAQIVERVDHTMRLEAQNRSQEEKEEEIQELADEMVRTLSREIWEEAE